MSSTEQKVVPCVWFDGDADDAVAFYLTVFPGSREHGRSVYPNEGLAEFQKDMAGKTLTIDFSIGDVRLTALNAGTEFEPNPMLSFILNFDPSVDPAAADRLDAAWQRRQEQRQLFVNDLYLTLVRRPLQGRVGLLDSLREKLGRTSSPAETAAHDLRQLDTAREALMAALGSYAPMRPVLTGATVIALICVSLLGKYVFAARSAQEQIVEAEAEGEAAAI